ncbi:MAG TPA: hypothetical protein VGK73_11535 [Polyangiaceae bacterium]
MRGARLLLLQALLLLAGLLGCSDAPTLAHDSDTPLVAVMEEARLASTSASVTHDLTRHDVDQRYVPSSLNDFIDLQSEAEPRPDPVAPDDAQHGRGGRAQPHRSGGSCRAAGRQGPDTGSLLALLALANARARDGAARRAASA